MSEEAKPVICSDCGQPMDPEQFETPNGVDSWVHPTDFYCMRALRAALDQERSDNAQLRAFAQDCEALWLNGGVNVLSLGDMLQRHKLIAGPIGNPTALLSGRGEQPLPAPPSEGEVK